VLPPATLALDYAAHRQVLSVLKPFVGSSGWFELSKLTVESLDTEEFLVFTAQADSGRRSTRGMPEVASPARQDRKPTACLAPDLSVIREAEMQVRSGSGGA